MDKNNKAQDKNANQTLDAKCTNEWELLAIKLYNILLFFYMLIDTKIWINKLLRKWFK